MDHPDFNGLRTVALVEDDERTRERFIRTLQAMPGWHVLFAAATLDGVRRSLARAAPDVLLVDLGLPDGDGHSLIAEVAHAHPTCQTLVISVFGDDEKVFRCIEAGAAGYIVKGQGDDELAHHLRDLLAGGSPVSPRIARRLLQSVRLHRGGQPGKTQSDVIDSNLTLKEHEVLSMLALGYSYQEVADRMTVSVNTVRFHVKSIYSKLYVSSRGEAVYEAGRRGWLSSLGFA